MGKAHIGIFQVANTGAKRSTARRKLNIPIPGCWMSVKVGLGLGFG